MDCLSGNLKDLTDIQVLASLGGKQFLTSYLGIRALTKQSFSFRCKSPFTGNEWGKTILNALTQARIG